MHCSPPPSCLEHPASGSPCLFYLRMYLFIYKTISGIYDIEYPIGWLCLAILEVEINPILAEPGTVV